jgi:tetratricopeptide (TPR) repeat protein
MSDESFKKLQVFIASPSDVADEKERLIAVIEQLNHGLADYLGIVLEAKEWSQVFPAMGRGQQVIFDQIPVQHWDIMIGIMWLRYGTAAGGKNPRESGVHEEFSAAYECWQKTGKPNIMFYRCIRPPKAITNIDTNSLARINKFFLEFETNGRNLGLYHTFFTTDDFERIVRDHLEKLLLKQAEQLKGRVLSKQEIQVYSNNIPDTLPRPAPFFGRKGEIEKVMRAISPEDRSWGIIIDGIGGIGKTALAVEVAHLCKQQSLFDGFLFVSAKRNRLDPKGIQEMNPAAETLDGFLNETALALGHPGIAQLTGSTKRRALLETLRNRHLLLIYDNLETLQKNEQEALTDFLRELPQRCKAIITSRRRGGEGAVWLRLDKLDWEAGHSIIKDEIARDSQLEKMLQAAGEKKWRALFDETGGSPLAIKHILGLMRVRFPRLSVDGALKMLRGRDKGTLSLQQFVYQETLQELGENDIAALSALAFFSSAKDEQLAAVARLSEDVLDVVLEHLNTLALVNLDLSEDRYSLHPLTRAFVHSEFLADPEDEYRIGMRFAEFWVGFARQFGGHSPESYKYSNSLDVEWPNLDATAGWLWNVWLDSGESNKQASQQLVDLAKSVSLFLSYSGRWDEYTQINENAYQAARCLENPEYLGWRAYDLAWIHYKRSRPEEARGWLKKCMRAWDQGGTKGDRASATKLKGLLAQHEKRYDEAEALLLEALSIRRKLQEENKETSKEVAYALSSLGQLALEKKEYAKAKRCFDEAIELNQATNDLGIQASLSDNLGKLALYHSQWDEAQTWFERAISLARDVGRVELLGRGKFGLAQVWEAKGRREDALKAALEASTIYERLQLHNLDQVRSLVKRLMTNEV